jgi:Icc protein
MPITIVQITDTHIHDQPLADFKGTQPDLYLRRVLRHIRQAVKHFDCLVLTGDITHDGSADACRQLTQLLDPIDCPIYLTPGNHDQLQIIEAHLLSTRIEIPERIELGHWQLLFADSHVEGRTAGRITEASMRRLEQQLCQHTQPTLLFTHHPPISINSQWMDEIGMHNGEQFISRMLQHQQLQAIIFGHIHQHWDSQIQNLRLLGTPSTCVQFRPLSQHFGIDPLDPGYRVLELQQQHFDSRVIRCPMRIEKILSGGQTGVDRAALDCALELAIPHGGWCPRGRRALDGPLDPIYQLQETPSSAYSQRTEWNVRDADATLLLSWGPPDGGSALTAELAEKLRKPLLIIDLRQSAPIDSVTNKLWQWLEQHDIHVLNIAGPRHSKADNIYTIAMQLLMRILCRLT